MLYFPNILATSILIFPWFPPMAWHTARPVAVAPRSQRRRRVEAYGPLDFDGRAGEQLRAASASEAELRDAACTSCDVYLYIYIYIYVNIDIDIDIYQYIYIYIYVCV